MKKETNEKMLIDGNKLMMHLADWWYSSFGQEETEESKAVRKVMEEIEKNLPKFALKEDGPWIPTDEALPEKDGEYLVSCRWSNENAYRTDVLSYGTLSEEANGEGAPSLEGRSWDGKGFGEEWDGPADIINVEEVTAWMPIPKPYVPKCVSHLGAAKVHVTAWPWATVEGTLETPEGLNEDQKRDFIEAHWSEIKFGKPSLDYTGTEYELNKSEIVMARKKPDEKKLDELVNRMSHAFYSILGCLDDNMPDCGDDEYVKECNELYDSALLEFKNAEEEFRNGLTEK